MTDLTPEAKALLELARDGDAPTDVDRARLRRAVAAGIGAGVAGHSSIAAAASKSVLGVGSAAAGKTSVALWLVAGAVAGLAGSAAVFVATRGSDAPVAHTAVVSAPAAKGEDRETPSVAKEPVAVEEPRDTRASASPASNPERVSAPTPVARAATPALQAATPESPAAAARTTAPDDSAVRGFAAPRPSTLGAETSLLEGARTALGQGDAAGALRLLERHEREFPGGVLVEERLAAKVFALCGLGRRAEAVRTAARLLESSPNSPLRARVLDSCAYRP